MRYLLIMLSLIVVHSTAVASITPPATEPLAWTKNWLAEENKSNSTGSGHIFATLVTVNQQGQPSARIVEVQFTDDNTIVFFTHKNTRKVGDLTHNPKAAIHLWLPNSYRQISIEGSVTPLDNKQLATQWAKAPKTMQARFVSSDHMSQLDSLQALQQKYKMMMASTEGKIELPEEFVGYALKPSVAYFYAVNPGDFSDKFTVAIANGKWQISRIES